MTTEAQLRLGIDATRMRTGAAQATASLQQVQRATTGASAATAGLIKQMAGLVSVMASFRTVQHAVRTIANYEEAIMAVRAVVIPGNAALAEQNALFAALNKTARDLGATTRFTAAEAAQGLLNLGRAGFTAHESIAAVASTLDLAVAGMLPLAEASEFVANAIRQFGLDAGEATRVADVFAMTSNRSNTDIRQLAEGLNYAGPFARSLGVSVEDAAAAIGTLSDAGIKASMAGTNLRGVFSRLLNPTGEAERALRDAGLSLADIDVGARGVAPVIRSLREAMDGMATDTDRARFALTLFGRLQVSGALALAAGVDKLEQLAEMNRAAAGEAARMRAVMDDTLRGKVKSLVSALEELALVIGESGVLSGLRDATDFATQVARALAGVSEELGPISEGAKIVASALKAMAIAGAAWVALKLPGVFVALGKVLIAHPLFAIAAALGAAIEAAGGLDKVLRGMHDTLEKMGTYKLPGFDIFASARDARSKARSDAAYQIQMAKFRAMGDGDAGLGQDRLDPANLEQHFLPGFRFNEPRSPYPNALPPPPLHYETAHLKHTQGLESQVERLRELADGMGEAFSRAFGDFVIGAKSAGQAVASLGQELSRFLLQALVLEPLKKAISGSVFNLLGSFTSTTPGPQAFGLGLGAAAAAAGADGEFARGGVFRHGRVVPFAGGGVVHGPTRFPMAGGLVGLMGEAGSEAIMPLRRGPGGKLGVEASGGTQVVNVTMNITTPDADSFRRSKGAIVADIRRALGRG